MMFTDVHFKQNIGTSRRIRLVLTARTLLAVCVICALILA